MSDETIEARTRLDLSMNELTEIQVLLLCCRDILRELIDDPASLLEELSVGYEKDRIKRLKEAYELLLERSCHYVKPGKGITLPEEGE